MSHTNSAVHRRALLIPVLLLVGFGVRGADAQTVFTSNATINDGDATYDGQDIIVRGCTVTINGAHAFNSLTIERNTSNSPGVVTHSAGFRNGPVSGVALTIATDMQIQGSSGGVASWFNVDERGFPVGQGPGAGSGGCGAGYGGLGGYGAGGSPGSSYGSTTTPNELGSGSARYSGGGAVRLSVAGTLTVDGTITAGGGGGGGPGSSGGTINISTGVLAGTGTIRANGGRGQFRSDAAGGGGRIAIAYNMSTHTGAVQAYGATGGENCGYYSSPGTIVTYADGDTLPRLRVDNGGTVPCRGTSIDNSVTYRAVDILGKAQAYSGGLTVDEHLTVSDAFAEASGLTTVNGHVLIYNNSTLTHSAGFGLGLQIVAGSMTVSGGSTIDADQKGYARGQGPGAGTGASGASHGGRGAYGNGGSPGPTYGSMTAPIDLGSGSASYAGGGAIRLTVAGTLMVDGAIRANGGGGGGAGASGGSIWIKAGELGGAGTIQAHGGAGQFRYDAAGGGGRISMAYDSASYSGTVSAYGAGGGENYGYYSAPGTIVSYVNGDVLPNLRIDNGATVTYQWTQFEGGFAYRAVNILNYARGSSNDIVIDGNLTVSGNALANLNGSILVSGDVSLLSTATLRHSSGTAGLYVAAGNFTIDATSGIALDELGYPVGTGPGAGTGLGGAGYGGAGGWGRNGQPGGAYGSADEPIELGSGSSAQAGGGAIQLTIEGACTVDGSISANGGDGWYQTGPGSSGGSIWLTAATLAGSGTISANGGIGWATDGAGGGGGGRIAVYTCDSTFDTNRITASGGAGYSGYGNGGAGTKQLADLSAPQITTQPQDWQGLIGETATFTVTADGDGPFTYEWQKDGQSLTDGPTGDGSTIAGATTETLTISDVALADAGAYSCAVSSLCGSSTSDDATLEFCEPQAYFRALGFLPGDIAGGPAAVSADGMNAAGVTADPNRQHAVLWTESGAMGIGSFYGLGYDTWASDVTVVSAYPVVVGAGRGPGPGYEAYRWTQADGIVGLGYLGGQWNVSRAEGISTDGSMIVGWSAPDPNLDYVEGFFWTQQNGMTGVGLFPARERDESFAMDIADTGLVVGYASSRWGDEGFRWSSSEGLSGLGTLGSGPPYQSQALAVSADGTFIIGWATGYLGREGFRWSLEDGMVGLGDVHAPNFASTATGISPDGEWIVGYTGASFKEGAIIWRGTNAPQPVVDVLASHNVQVPEGWFLLEATDVATTQCGTTVVVVGIGRNPDGMAEGWMAVFPACDPPSVSAHPADQSVELGATVTLDVLAAGGEDLAYRWRKEGQALGDGPTGNGSTISGAGTSTLTLTNVQAADAGDYDCVVSDACGLAASEAATLEVGSFNCLAWEEIPAAGPSGRGGHGMAYDRARDVMVVFGGFDGANYLGDTWEFDGANWTLRSTTGPAARRGHSMAFDSARGVTVFYGGWSDANGSTYYDDTWEWDGTSWTQVAASNPPRRAGHAMIHDSGRGVTVVFGGHQDEDAESPLGDTWEWDGATWALASSSGPSPRTGITMAYDTQRGVAVLFGGNTGSLTPDDETWEWDGVDWALRATSGPTPRWGHTLSFDPVRGATVLFGGDDLDTLYADTWEWDGGGWTQRTLAGPPARRAHAADYDSARSRVVVFGGWDDAADFYYGDTWVLSGGNPVEVTDQPDGWSGWVGDAALLHVTAAGQGDLTYQWRKDGQALADGPTGYGSTISGATTATLTIANTQTADNGAYDCLINDACGAATSDEATLDAGMADPRLFVVLNPEPQCVCVGEVLTVEVRMGDLGPQLADGFQAFLGFDTAKLQYLGGDYTDDPFGFHIIEPIRVTGGTIDMAASVNPMEGQSPTNADALLATLTFQVLASDGPTTIGFRPHDPPSRLSFEGDDIGAQLADTPEFVVDLTPPTVTPPADISTDSDAGTCEAALAVGLATADDACDADPIIVGTRDDALALTDPYPGGATTTITWTATDACGNVGTARQLVIVFDRNIVEVASVELGGVHEASLLRCITFELVDCEGSTYETSQEVTFANGVSAALSLSVPCGLYDCIAARDKQHTLRRYDGDDFGIVGRVYSASFIDAGGSGGDDDALEGGNLNDDRYIDILDFSVFVSKWNTNYGTGDTTCSLSGRHADVSGNGLASTEDFTFMYVGFLHEHEASCCGLDPDGGGDDDGPVTDISVEDLRAMGEPDLVVADLTGDGRVNLDDVAAFMAGERPRKKPNVQDGFEAPQSPKRLERRSKP